MHTHPTITAPSDVEPATRPALRGALLGTVTAIAAAIAVLSALPLWQLDVDAGSKLWLTAMHLATGVCAIAAQRAAHDPT